VSDRNSLIVLTENGRVIRVFCVRPDLSVLRGARVGGSGDRKLGASLRSRGMCMTSDEVIRTSVVVEGISTSEDRRG
jgi:hypothetical protein